MKYKVRFFQDSTYQVLDEADNTMFQGSLADCEAWIRLTEKGYL